MSKPWATLFYRMVKLSGLDVYRVEHLEERALIMRVMTGHHYHWVPVTRWEMDYTGEDGSNVPEEFSSRAAAYGRMQECIARDREHSLRSRGVWQVVD